MLISNGRVLISFDRKSPCKQDGVITTRNQFVFSVFFFLSFNSEIIVKDVKIRNIKGPFDLVFVQVLFFNVPVASKAFYISPLKVLSLKKKKRKKNIKKKHFGPPCIKSERASFDRPSMSWQSPINKVTCDRKRHQTPFENKIQEAVKTTQQC